MVSSQMRAAFLALCIAIQARVPVLLWGKPGVGKTTIIKQMAKELDIAMELLTGNNREPSDILGLPIITDDGVIYSPPAWAKRLANKSGILFLDELTTSLPAVQAAFLRVVNERVVGEIELGDFISVVGAANPADIAANGCELNTALANRWLHIDWAVEQRDWSNKMRTVHVGGMNRGWSIPPFPFLPANWEAEMEVSYKLVADFIDKFPHLLDDCPTDLEKAGRAWPSPRSWEMAAKLLAAARSISAGLDVIELIVSGTVGQATSITFSKWLSEQDLPDPEDLLVNFQNYQFPINRHDKVHTILLSICAAFKRNPTIDRYFQTQQVLCLAARQGYADIAYPSVTQIVKLVPPGAARTIPEMSVFGSLLNDNTNALSMVSA